MLTYLFSTKTATAIANLAPSHPSVFSVSEPQPQKKEKGKERPDKEDDEHVSAAAPDFGLSPTFFSHMNRLKFLCRECDALRKP